MNLTITLRRIAKNAKWFFLSVLGLSIAFACVLLVYSFVKNEFSYDKFHPKADRIYRITINTNTGKSSMIDARISSGYVKFLEDNISDIQNVVKISSYRKAVVTIGENSFFSTKVFGVDSNFFSLFDFKLLTGNKNELFNHPKQVAITESIAKKYFGTTDVINKNIFITHQKVGVPETYTIKGILQDFPENSHFKADILCSYKELISRNTWNYTYALLPDNMTITGLQDTIQHFLDTTYSQSDFKPIVDLQLLTSIHLHSHKSRELEPNANVQSLYLLISGIIILLFIALINYANINYVRYLSEQKSIMIKKINGATSFSLIKDFFKEVMIFLILIITLGILSGYYVAEIFDFKSLQTLTSVDTAMVTIVFALLVTAFAILPFLYRKTGYDFSQTVKTKSRLYKVLTILQFSLSIIVIAATMFLQKQINYINSLHPSAKNSDIIVITKNTPEAVANYQLLKEQLLKHPEFIDITAAMEEPGGTVTDNFEYILDGKIKDPENRKTINLFIVDTNFFSFMKIKPVAGTTDLSTSTTLQNEKDAIQIWQMEMRKMKISDDLRKKTLPYEDKYILNKTALEHLGIKNAEEAIGKRFRIKLMGQLFPEGKIVGVVDDFHYTNLFIKEKPLVITNRKLFCHNFIFRVNPHQKSKAIAVLKDEWGKINPDIPFQYEYITDSYRKIYQKEYNQMRVLFLFSIISILLSLMGLFAMVSFNLKLKVKEIGIRKVNGATVLQLIKMFNKEFVIMTIIAFAFAAPVIWYSINRWLQSFAYKTPLSWWVFALAGCLVIIISLLTVSGLVYFATRKNPVEALRYE